LFTLTTAVFRIVARPIGLVEELGANYVIVDLAAGKHSVEPVVANGPGGENFVSMMHRVRPWAAITGTFYDSNYRPQGDILIDGRVVFRGHHRQGIGFTQSGRICFRERKINERINWRGCRSGIASGPRLVRKGKVDIDVRRDGFGPAATTIKASRCAVGATADGRLILCAVAKPITLSTMAKVMIELGSTDAINLDGGGSCALYVNERFIIEPHRPVSNVLAVFLKNTERAER
jgi:exopolysaccharide biosynthesis protein